MPRAERDGEGRKKGTKTNSTEKVFFKFIYKVYDEDLGQ